MEYAEEKAFSRETPKALVELHKELEMLTIAIHQLHGQLIPVMRDQDKASEKTVGEDRPHYSSQLAKMLGDEVSTVRQAHIIIDTILAELEV